MAENEVKIKVTTETETSALEGLDSLLDDIKGKGEDIGQALQTAFDEATAEVERLKEELQFAEDYGFTDETEELQAQLEEAEEKAQSLSDALDEIDSKTVSPDVDPSGIDDLKQNAEETSSSIDSVTTALVGIGATAGLEQMVSTADRINTSWNRLELTFEGTGVSMDALKTKSTQLSTTTGRAGGIIRDYFNQMGIAGVTNADLLSSSFEALSGKSYQTGNSIESMETKMQTMVLSGTASARMLKGLGLSAEDLARVMGVSADQVSEAFKNLTPEERLQAITQAMGDGAKANEMYKNSYEGLKAQADAAMAGLMGAVGQAILPVVVPALQAATNAIKFLTDGFKALPGPVQAIIGGIGGFAAVALTVVGVLGTVGQMIKMVQGGLQALNLVTKLSTLATQAMSAAQTVLNVVMSMNPIMLVVIALIALAAALVWAYYNVDWFREMVDNAWASIVQFGAYLWDSLIGTIQWLGQVFANTGQIMQDSINNAVSVITSALQGLWNYIITLGGLLPANVDITGNKIIDTVLRVMAFIFTLPFQLAIVFANVIAKTLGFGDNFVQGLISSASKAVSGFASYLASLPGIVMDEFNRVLGLVNDFINSLPSRVWDMGAAIIDALKASLGIGSPGYMYYMVEGEFDRIDNLTKKTSFDTAGIGQRMVSDFNPDMKFANGSIMNNGGGDVYITIEGDVDSDRRIQQIVDVVRRELNWNNKTAGRVI